MMNLMKEGQIKHLRPKPRIGSLRLDVIWTGMATEKSINSW